jgi:predicted PurR-regulated permease PerM
MPMLVNSAALVVLIWGIAAAGPFLVPLCISALLAFLLAPFVRYARAARIPEWVAIVISALLLILPLTAFGYAVFQQAQSLVRDFPQIKVGLERILMTFMDSPLGQRLRVREYLHGTSVADAVAGWAGRGAEFAVSALGHLLGAGSQLALVLLIAIVMLASRRHLRISAERILGGTDAAREMLNEVSRLIERFLTARFLIMIIVGALDGGILLLFGIPYSYLMASFLGIMTAVPAIGFFVAAIPPLVVAAATGHSGLEIGGLAVALTIVSIFEGNVLTPKMVGGRLNINALATFVGLFAGSLIWGIWGMLLSIPILGVLRIAMTASPRLRPWSMLLASPSREAPPSEKRPQPWRQRSGTA